MIPGLGFTEFTDFEFGCWVKDGCRTIGYVKAKPSTKRLVYGFVIMSHQICRNMIGAISTS